MVVDSSVSSSCSCGGPYNGLGNGIKNGSSNGPASSSSFPSLTFLSSLAAFAKAFLHDLFISSASVQGQMTLAHAGSLVQWWHLSLRFTAAALSVTMVRAAAVCVIPSSPPRVQNSVEDHLIGLGQAPTL